MCVELKTVSYCLKKYYFRVRVVQFHEIFASATMCKIAGTFEWKLVIFFQGIALPILAMAADNNTPCNDISFSSIMASNSRVSLSLNQPLKTWVCPEIMKIKCF